MTELERIREAMTAFLKGEGVAALTAWPGEDLERPEGPVTAVSLRSCPPPPGRGGDGGGAGGPGPAAPPRACRGGGGGFQDYLGERYDAGTGHWQELYGKRLQVTFGLDLYAPEGAGAAGMQAAFDALAGALSGGGPPGLRVKEFSRGETSFDQALGLFHCPAEAVCTAYLYAVAEEGGAFLDFVVKGEADGIDDT